MREETEGLLSGLRLTLHPRKSRVYRCAEGVTFLGWRVFPHRTRLVRQNVVRFRRRMRWLQAAYAKGRIDAAKVQHRFRAWIAHAAHGDTWRLRLQIFGQFAFGTRCAV